MCFEYCFPVRTNPKGVYSRGPGTHRNQKKMAPEVTDKFTFIAVAAGFPVCGLQAPECMGLGFAVCRLLSSCGAQA